MITESIKVFEELKQYVYMLNIGKNGTIAIKFCNKHFYHLIGLHKVNLDMFIPNYIKSAEKKYKFIKNNSEKFDRILDNQIREKHSLELRIVSFKNILDLLKGNNVKLYNLKERVPNSLYDGDYGLSKTYDRIYCLLGLKCENSRNDIFKCAPQSWMSSLEINRLVENKKPMFLNGIITIPVECFDETDNMLVI